MSIEGFSRELLNVLDRYEKQISSLNRNDLIELFCLQIIPFIEQQALLAPLRESWSKQYLELFHIAQDFEKKALDEEVEIFSQLRGQLQNKLTKPVKEQIARIEKMISGNFSGAFSSWPIYKTIYFEIKALLKLLLENGDEKLCGQFAILDFAQEAVIQENAPPKLIKKPYIKEVSNTPSFEKASNALRAIHWDQINNPAIVWWYFKSALWCWNTPEDYFNKLPELFKKQTQNPIPPITEKGTWLEIAAVKYRKDLESFPVVFTDNFFRLGLANLTNNIYAFASNDFQLNENESDPIEKMIFELKLHGNQLWIFVHTGLSEPKMYYIKRFNEGMVGGSTPYDFIKPLLQNHPEGGDVEVPLVDNSDSISKAISRLGLDGPLKDLFFGQSRGSHVLFKGAQVAINRDEECRDLLGRLQEIHEKFNSPEYDENAFSLQLKENTV